MPLGTLGAARALTAAAAVAVVALSARGAEQAQRLEDVQIGERGSILRVALICSTRCEIAPSDGIAFRLVGVETSLDVDLEQKSALARRLTISAQGGGSVLAIDPRARVNAARIVDCDSDSGPAPCIEYRFATAHAAAPAADDAKPPLRAEPPAEIAAARPTEEIPILGALTVSPHPSLRDDASEIPRFAPPERLVPPAVGTAAFPVGRPSLIAVDRADAFGADFDFRAEAADILGKSFDIGGCEGAKARLSGDAWALDAMVDNAFCKAGEGKFDEADADFARLLAYTPDNYEALVGRGLVAFAKGERERGRALFQNALDALPPIAESDRIAAAIERN